jgi:hypothetical protein
MPAADLADFDDPESVRLREDAARTHNWKRWGPYLSDRQWGTVREDYSASGDAWAYFPFEHAASRAYRWGEDGILGICDRQCRLCFAPAFWNGKDPILKERLFGLSNPQGNHGEDVKEEYFHLDATPTASYLKGLYKYPHAEFPYRALVERNQSRGRHERELELADLGVFADNRYHDCLVEYAKAADEDLLIRLTVTNRGPDTARLVVLPTLWFRNTWTWNCTHEGCDPRPRMWSTGPGRLELGHFTLGSMVFAAETPDQVLFTENETNNRKLYGGVNESGRARDGIAERLIRDDRGAASEDAGTRAAAVYNLALGPGQSRVIRLRLTRDKFAAEPFGPDFDRVFEARIAEADRFHGTRIGVTDPERRRLARSAYAGLIWTKQFYHYAVRNWLDGDPSSPAPPAARREGRNRDWGHLFNRDIISMPDKWEYPWYALWDSAFHMLPMARIDPHFAKEQLLLFLREWYMHPSGQLPAYEWDFGDVNPPVHAWAVYRVYKMTGRRGARDTDFLEKCFHKLMLNFTWWVNRKDVEGRHLFSGGFLGLDNIGVFDRSKPLPAGHRLMQADGTAWMAFYCTWMLAIALELAQTKPVYEDVASKFFEHFVAIADAMNEAGGTGLWCEETGFYYDLLRKPDGHSEFIRTASAVGLVPLFAVLVLEGAELDALPGFRKRMQWLLDHRKDLADRIAYMSCQTVGDRKLLAIPSRDRLARILRRMFDPNEFLSPHGIRSFSRRHLTEPYVFGGGNVVRYVSGESDNGLFGGNSNWRGPIWFPTNYLLIDALKRYHHFYGDDFKVEYPTGSGRHVTLKEAADDLGRRLTGLFLTNGSGRRPYETDAPVAWSSADPNAPHLFHEYFDGDTGRGLGASHQTGWTALVAKLIEEQP